MYILFTLICKKLGLFIFRGLTMSRTIVQFYYIHYEKKRKEKNTRTVVEIIINLKHLIQFLNL